MRRRVKSLNLLRHAKSGWDNPLLRDFDRPLNERGRRAGEAIGGAMAAAGLRFDRVRASPAVRVRETIAAVETRFGSLEARYDERIYLASAATLLELVNGLDDDAATALLVGHNPGLEDLLMLLVPAGDGLRAEVEEKYPTATLATLEADVDHWSELAAGGARLVRFIRPRDLDPSLGPDD